MNIFNKREFHYFNKGRQDAHEYRLPAYPDNKRYMAGYEREQKRMERLADKWSATIC